MWKFTWFFTIMVMLLFLQNHSTASAIKNLSPRMQKNALFQFKQSLSISYPQYCSYHSPSGKIYDEIRSHPKTNNWSMSSDYCTWEGVTCEQKTGNVIGLDLACGQLEGAILPNSTLFQLSHLRFLDLSWNRFLLSNQFPEEFGFFARGLTHLNLSNTGFPGKVPLGISQLYKLISLDLSDTQYPITAKLEYKVFKLLLQNLTQLRVLNLEGLNITSVLPMNFSTTLRVLNLQSTNLHGVLPQEVFHLPNLELLYLSRNHLAATLPKVKWGSSGSLQHLYLQFNNIYEGIPASIGFLESLVTLVLDNCTLSGSIPRSIGNLGQLTYLSLSHNNLNGQIPTLLANLTNLRVLSFSYNNFTGPFPSFVIHPRKLIQIDLRSNSLTGPLPPWLFDLPLLETLDLGHNVFRGPLHEFDSSMSRLQSFDCTRNSLYGPIPQSFSQHVNLTLLDLSFNNFSGVLDFNMFSRHKGLDYLDLSHNSVSVKNTSMVTLSPKLYHLGLSSCNMEEFPHFSADVEFGHYDLSDPKIPRWIGPLTKLSYSSYLNLSHNRLTGGLEQLPWDNIRILDLQSNMLYGSLPTLICNSSSLEILNLSHNNLSGVLPSCPTNFYPMILILDLRMNNIQGNIPATLSNFRALKTINFNGNKLDGKIPSSFAEFDFLEVLDLGSNQIDDTFPQCLEALARLKVLILKSNKFHGLINKSSEIEHPIPSLRIIDLSYNEFSGPLPAIYFKNFKAMMNVDVNGIKAAYLGIDLATSFYSDTTNLVIKGVEIEFVRILTVFTTIDVSRNNFEGKIPDNIGNLVSLRYLNLSQNHITGHIPLSIGKLSVLESLDLSSNQLGGEIPQQLTSIYTLARLNLSCNQLGGHIPQGSQFSTFDNNSYVGNLELCGIPLSKDCKSDTEMQEESEDDNYFFSGFTWEAVVIGYGCGMVPTFIIGYLMLLAGKPKWYAGIIARELGLKIRRMEIRTRF